MWWYFFSKAIELMDTVLMVLRKKNNQITFLHWFHHASMLNIWWWVMMWAAGGNCKLKFMFLLKFYYKYPSMLQHYITQTFLNALKAYRKFIRLPVEAFYVRVNYAVLLPVLLELDCSLVINHCRFVQCISMFR